ncbi:molybdopterin cofactor-binding domain-containing protein, partial [Pseudomonas aeruginosa]|uniref:molybdopterin cofactor-binding domain-containing protein n=1 Tax=Pseudomonas aeruginosa TaxID=287 RepID=UPI000BC4EE22
IAVTEAFKTFVAQVVEVSVDKDGKLKVERVVCAVDCGIPINPGVISYQAGMHRAKCARRTKRTPCTILRKSRSILPSVPAGTAR